MRISQTFSRRIESTFGEAGRDWLKALPSILKTLSQKWSLILQSPFADMSYNYVAPAIRSDGMSVVLKVGVPNPELFTEIEALRLFDGNGAIALLETEPDLGAMLLERLDPGEAIFHLEDDERATKVAIQVMAELHASTGENGSFPSVADWAKGLKRLRNTFNGGTGPFPSHLVERVEGIVHEFMPSMESPVLLHGDLHHWNILSASRSPWLAIDPKGVIGESAYEAGAWIRNPFPQMLEWPDRNEVIERRMDQFASEMGVERDRIHGWSLYQTVLAAWWSYEEGDSDWETWLAVAELMI